MKKTFLKISTAFIVILSFTALSSCGEAENNHSESEEIITEESDVQLAAVYQCPMKCEGDKTYSEASQCPTCGMDLKEVEVTEVQEDEDHQGHDHSEHNH